MFNNFDIESELTPQKSLPLQLLVVAMMMGILIFVFVIFILYSSSEAVNNPNIGKSNADFLVYLAILYSPISILIAQFISNLQLKKLADNQEGITTIDEYIQSLTVYYIIKIAIYESGAFLSGIIIMLSVTYVITIQNELIWLCLIPIIIFFIVSAINFPSRQKLIDLYNQIVSLN